MDALIALRISEFLSKMDALIALRISEFLSKIHEGKTRLSLTQSKIDLICAVCNPGISSEWKLLKLWLNVLEWLKISVIQNKVETNQIKNWLI